MAEQRLNLSQGLQRNFNRFLSVQLSQSLCGLITLLFQAVQITGTGKHPIRKRFVFFQFLLTIHSDFPEPRQFSERLDKNPANPLILQIRVKIRVKNAQSAMSKSYTPARPGKKQNHSIELLTPKHRFRTGTGTQYQRHICLWQSRNPD